MSGKLERMGKKVLA